MALGISLVFPPQWSPFQPALAVPALCSWLRKNGVDVKARDSNVEFFHWLASEQFCLMVHDVIDATGWSEERKRAYRRVLCPGKSFIDWLDRIGSNNDDSLDDHLAFNKILNAFLAALSDVQDQFSLSAYGLELKSGTLSVENIEEFLAHPHPILAAFASGVADALLSDRFNAVGLSCIGQDQLLMTALIGRIVKDRNPEISVIVGGTIFSRIFERGALPRRWFGSMFDYVVFNEGEKPLLALLQALNESDPDLDSVPGIAFASRDRGIIRTSSAPPLKPEELSIPDFDDLDLSLYLSSKISLPILSSRGCYWGKCEFCHHGMVYGEKYTSYETERVWEEVELLSKRYGVKHFAFNDEAIPPKIFRGMGKVFSPTSDSGYSFTGLLKFEKYFTLDDYRCASNVGFRTIYVGLESASERVLDLMKKRTSRETITKNLNFAAESGIWMHCFLFFGFPGERDADAKETYDFIVENSDIVSSFGAGTFALEHNAPIFKHLEDFGLRLSHKREESVNVFYKYEVSNGLDSDHAVKWMDRLNDAASKIPNYTSVGWIPREHLLFLMAEFGREKIRTHGKSLSGAARLPSSVSISRIFEASSAESSDCLEVSCLTNGRATRLTGSARAVFEILYDDEVSVSTAFAVAKPLLEGISA